MMAIMSIDVIKNIGKPIILGIYQLRSRHKPPHFKDTTGRGSPKVSIIIPTHNESSTIRKMIDSCLENPYHNKEIIVVDDHSTDSTFQVAYPYHQRGEIKLLQRKGSKGSRASAINFGVTFATGTILIVIDADSIIERNAIFEVVKYMSLPNVVAGAGNVRVISGDDDVTNLLTKCQSYEYMIAFELGRRLRLMLNILVVIPGAFSVMTKDLGKKIGLYDKDTITEDFDLTLKIFKTGQKVTFIPTAICWTFCPYTWKGWIRQRIRWSHGQIATLVKHRNVVTSRTIYKPLLILGVFEMLFMDIVLLFARLFSILWLAIFFSETVAYVLILVTIIYFISEIVVFITAVLFSSRKSDIKYGYLMPFIVLIYRPFYGAIRLASYVLWFFKKEVPW
jgi:cellulose synthase/poly-beta-1,6-N-acetylglucosamine synthase-like glycosyltransferase